MKKGQAAIEFLMTYGWVLLVVLIAVSALAYFGILTPGENLPETCLFFPGIACDSFKVDPNGVTIMISNGWGKNLENVSFTIMGSGPCEGGISNIENLKDGTLEVFSIDCPENLSSGSAFKRELRINYTEERGLSHSKVGEISTKVE